MIKIAGTNDSITVTGWFSSPANRLDGVQFSGGQLLTATQVEALVSSMVAFNPGGTQGIAVGEPGPGMPGRPSEILVVNPIA